MRFVVGLEQFQEFTSYYKRAGFSSGELGATEEKIITSDPSHLILWRDNGQIIGHAIWHESNTREHRGGSPREENDVEVLERLTGPGKNFVELHEVWLRREFRGNGYGKRFFSFFEGFVAARGHHTIVYYPDEPAALHICRNRGYREARNRWYVFALDLNRMPSSGEAG